MAKIKLTHVKRAVELGKDVYPYAAPILKKFAPAVMDQTQRKAKQAADGVVDAKDSAFVKMQQRKKKKEYKKSLDKARKKAVESSLPPISAKEFFKNFEDNISNSEELNNGYMAIIGCYAIITLKSQREKDFSAYEDVYVGCSKSVGFSVYSHFCGFGNIDVYADFKFKAPMMVLLFPCDEKRLEECFTGLLKDLQATESYNKWDVLLSDEVKE